MKRNLALLCLIFCTSLFSEPPREIPPDLLNAYTLDGAIPVQYEYLDESYPPSKPRKFSRLQIDSLIRRARRREQWYYGITDKYLYDAIAKNARTFRGKTVAVVGTVNPWYEAIALSFGAKVTTIEYNKLSFDYPNLKTMTVEEYRKNPIQFDYVISISSIEHDGLGRYGDPLDPMGDLRAIGEIQKMLKPDGLLFLAVPVGPDLLVWNLHRIYGEIRLPMLLEGWTIVDVHGFAPSDFSRPYNEHQHQPVWVLMH